MLKINFWQKNDSGNIMNHSNGLTQEEVDALRLLQPGDRLILWNNEQKEGTFATHTLKTYKKVEK